MQAGFRINKIGCRNRLGIVDVNGPGNGKALIVRINQVPGAIGRAQTAGRTFIRINITGAQTEFGGEITRLAIQGEKIGVAQNFDIWRPTGLN